MKTINYLLNAFGYKDYHDFSTTVFKLFYLENSKLMVPVIIGLGTIREFIEVSVGFNIAAVIGFICLIIAEFQTGVKVARLKRNQRIKSRKIGRMLFKIAVYFQLLWILNSFASSIPAPTIGTFEVNPFHWLYYVVLAGIIFQMVISYLENLSCLGYAEANGLLGIVLRKYNKWFEFDGSKDADNFNQSSYGKSDFGPDQVVAPEGEAGGPGGSGAY